MNKKLAGIFAMCALLLTGCQGAKESSKEITPPDTGWGKTVDEVLADWNLDRDQVEIFSETNSAAAIAVDTEATVFGEQTSRVMFQFINLDQTGATGKPVLCEVDITYPDDADMDTVKKEMEKSYGSSKDSITRYELYQSLGDDQLPEYTYKKADQLAVWSGESLKDAIPSDKSTEYETAWEAYQPGLTTDNWENYTEQASMATAVCAYGGCHACLFGVVLPVVGGKARLVCFPGGFVFGALIGRNRIFQALAGPDGKLICFFVSVFRELIVAQRLVQLIAGNGVFGTSVGFFHLFFHGIHIGIIRVGDVYFAQYRFSRRSGLIEVDKLKHDSGSLLAENSGFCIYCDRGCTVSFGENFHLVPIQIPVGKHFIHRFPPSGIRRRNFLAALFRSLTSSQQQSTHCKNTC